MVGRRRWRTSGPRSGTSSRSSGSPVRAGPRRAHHARRSLVRGRRAELRRARLPRPRPGRPSPSSTPPSSASSTELTLGRARASRSRRSRQACASSASSAATASSPTCRTAPRRSSPSSPRRRSERSGRAARRTSAPARVVDRFAQIEPKVLFAVDGYRYGGRDFDRLDAVAGLEAEMPSLEHTVLIPYLDPGRRPRRLARRDHLGRLLASGEAPAPLAFERVPVRPPALGPLLLRHDRPAEGDRPGPRRDPARAPEEAQPPRRRAGGRPDLLVHDHRLDDVELPRLGPAHAGLDRPLRRQPGPPGHGRPLGPRRAGRASPASAPRPATSPPA